MKTVFIFLLIFRNSAKEIKYDFQTQTFRSETLPVVSGLERKVQAKEQNLT